MYETTKKLDCISLNYERIPQKQCSESLESGDRYELEFWKLFYTWGDAGYHIVVIIHFSWCRCNTTALWGKTKTKNAVVLHYNHYSIFLFKLFYRDGLQMNLNCILKLESSLFMFNHRVFCLQRFPTQIYRACCTPMRWGV